MDLEHAVQSTGKAIADKLGAGRVATYIPALARVDPRKFGIAAVSVDGGGASFGDAREKFSIQSISKIFTLAIALGKVGDELWQRVGREPSGSAFNSIVQLEREQGIPRNPFINAGAIVVADLMLAGRPTGVALTELLTMLRTAARAPDINIDAEVAESELETGDRNRALAYFMHAYGNLKQPVSAVLDFYFSQCAIAMTCEELARSALFLANGGTDPFSSLETVHAQRARRINALMLTCGHYDASGDFAFKVGLPGKSGVGGGIVAVAPGRGAVCVWSPGLNENGNSLVGSAALEHFAQATGWSIF